MGDPIPTTLTPDQSTVNMYVGNTYTINYKLDPSDATGPVDFHSNDPCVSINNGVITANKPGMATISLSYTGNNDYGPSEATIAVFVDPAPTSIKPDNSNIDLAVGDSCTIGYTLNPSGAASYGSVGFQSNNDSVVTVDNSGKVTPVGLGSAKITISYECDSYKYQSSRAYVVVNVKAPSPSTDTSGSGTPTNVKDNSTSATLLDLMLPLKR